MSNVLLQCCMGMQCQEFCILAADQTNAQSILVMKTDEEKVHRVSDSLALAVNGDSGDSAQFAQFVSKNLKLYSMRNGYQLGTEAAAHFTRRTLAEALRSQSPYTVNLLLGGFEERQGGQLFYMDYLASCVRVPFAAHGFGGLLSMGLLEQHYAPTLKEREAYEVLKRCVQEIHLRLFVNLCNFQVLVIGKNGISSMPTINATSF